MDRAAGQIIGCRSTLRSPDSRIQARHSADSSATRRDGRYALRLGPIPPARLRTRRTPPRHGVEDPRSTWTPAPPVGLSRAAPDLFVGIGYSFRIDRLLR